MLDMLSPKAVMRDLFNEYAQKKARAESAADRIRMEIARKVPIYGDLSGAITRIYMDVAQRIAAQPEHAQEITKQGQEALFKLKADSEAALRTSGYTPQMLAPIYECPLCKDTGFVGEPVHEYCTCLRAALHTRLYERAGVREENFETFNLSLFTDEKQRLLMEKFHNYALRFADSFPQVDKRNTLLVGTSGLGKTFLLNCIYGRLLQRGICALRITAFSMMDIMRKAHRGQDEGELRQLLTAPVLILDDLGSEPMLENITVEYLFNLLNERKQAHLSTLIATNLTLRELHARYTERTLSRLAEKKDTAMLQFVGHDVRMGK